MTAGTDLRPARPMSFEPLDTQPNQDLSLIHI